MAQDGAEEAVKETVQRLARVSKTWKRPRALTEEEISRSRGEWREWSVGASFTGPMVKFSYCTRCSLSVIPVYRRTILEHTTLPKSTVVVNACPLTVP